VIREDLVVEPEDDIRRSGQVIERLANHGELLKAPAVFDALHLHQAAIADRSALSSTLADTKPGSAASSPNILSRCWTATASFAGSTCQMWTRVGLSSIDRPHFCEFDATDMGVGLNQWSGAGIDSASAARPGDAGNGSAKYWVSCVTRPSVISMMLTEYAGTPS
jgi:hypothetical protein